MTTRGIRNGLRASALGVAIAVSASGCGSSTPVGGVTNPNPGSVVDPDKAATRVDLPVPNLNADHKEPVAEEARPLPADNNAPAASSPSTTNNDARRASPEAATPSPSASPNADQNTGNASGATKPADSIREGTPKSPQ